MNYQWDYPYAGGAKAAPLMKTVPVGSLPPNAWGLHEMHGNVYEWCEDWYGDYPREKVVNPRGPDAGKTRVLRGGSWNDSAWGTRSAFRFHYEPGYRDDSLGFRLVRGREPASASKSGATARQREGVRDEPRELLRGSGARLDQRA